jgi:hypothetical protein
MEPPELGIRQVQTNKDLSEPCPWAMQVQGLFFQCFRNSSLNGAKCDDFTPVSRGSGPQALLRVSKALFSVRQGSRRSSRMHKAGLQEDFA